MRRTATVKIPPDATVGGRESRDKGKWYFLTEMPSAQTERWARRAIMALIKSGMEVPDEIAQAGIAGIAQLGLKAFGGIDEAIAESLLVEMFECVQFIPDPSHPDTVRAIMTDDDIEEVPTRVQLRLEVFALHTGFSMAEIRSKWTSATTKPAV